MPPRGTGLYCVCSRSVLLGRKTPSLRRLAGASFRSKPPARVVPRRKDEKAVGGEEVHSSRRAGLVRSEVITRPSDQGPPGAKVKRPLRGSWYGLNLSWVSLAVWTAAS